MNKLVFLGTGAGDMNMLLQKTKTSALYFELDNLKFILDPGPGTIVNAVQNKIDLTELDGLIVTHPHPDHYTDANALIDTLRKPNTFLIAGKKCLEPSERYWPCINKFQQQIPSQVYAAEPASRIKIGKLTFEFVEGHHLDVGLGLKILGSKKIGYVNDGSIASLEKHYKNMDILIFNVLIPNNMPAAAGVHTSVSEVTSFLNVAKPKQAIIQHFSLDMLDAGVGEQARIIQQATNIKTIAARDGMVVKL